MPGTVEVGEGALVLISDGKKTRWLPEGPLTFRSADTGDRLQFLEDAAGRITGFASAYGHAVADKVGPVDDPKNLALALGAVVLLSIVVIVGAWARRGRARGPYSRAAGCGAPLIPAPSIPWRRPPR